MIPTSGIGQVLWALLLQSLGILAFCMGINRALAGFGYAGWMAGGLALLGGAGWTLWQ